MIGCVAVSDSPVLVRTLKSSRAAAFVLPPAGEERGNYEPKFVMKREKMVANWARVALPAGTRL